MIIGITGIFSSGKSNIASIFNRNGYELINADHIAHELYENPNVKKMIVNYFGKRILTDGAIDRKKLKSIVFYNKSKLKELNNIIHPLIKKEILMRIKNSKPKNIVIEAAVMIEAGWTDAVDKILVTKVGKKNAMQRALLKGKYTKKEIETIFASQLPQTKKLKYADYVIDTSGSFEETESQAKKIIEEIG